MSPSGARESTLRSSAETWLDSRRSELALLRSQRRARAQARPAPPSRPDPLLWVVGDRVVEEPRWLANLGAMFPDALEQPEESRWVEVRPPSSPIGGWAWNRVVRRAARDRGMTVSQLRARMGEPAVDLWFLMKLEHGWKVVGPRLTAALSITSATLSDWIADEEEAMRVASEARRQDRDDRIAARERLRERARLGIGGGNR